MDLISQAFRNPPCSPCQGPQTNIQTLCKILGAKLCTIDSVGRDTSSLLVELQYINLAIDQNSGTIRIG